jgi:hypothetical protein
MRSELSGRDAYVLWHRGKYENHFDIDGWSERAGYLTGFCGY